MRRIITVLSFVLCVLVLSAQTNDSNVSDTPLDNQIDQIDQISNNSEPEEGIVEEESTKQETLVTQNTVPYYQQSKEWAKYIKLRKWGWSLFGGGLGSVLIGGCALVERVSGFNNGAAIGGFFIVTGTLATLSSVPVLICAYHQKYKAKRLNVGVSSMAVPNMDFSVSYTPAISLTYSF